MPDDRPDRNWSVTCDGDGYAIENRAGHHIAYLPVDCSGEGDFEAWNADARRWAYQLARLLNGEEFVQMVPMPDDRPDLKAIRARLQRVLEFSAPPDWAMVTTDLIALLAETERLEAENARLREAMEPLNEWIDRLAAAGRGVPPSLRQAAEALGDA